MGIDLGRGDVCVAKHLLDRADICPVLNKMRGERVSQRMWRDAFEAALFGVSFDEAVDHLTGQLTAGRFDKQVPNLDIFMLSAKREVAFEPFDG